MDHDKLCAYVECYSTSSLSVIFIDNHRMLKEQKDFTRTNINQEWSLKNNNAKL